MTEVEDTRARKLTLSMVESLKNRGYNQSEIAEMYGVTKQYVSWIKHTYGGRLTPREIVLKTFPWRVADRFTRATQYKLLRNHGEFVATDGVGMSQDKLKRLRSFYRKLRDERLIVEFDPGNEPQPGVSSVGGFVYCARTKADGDALVRLGKGRLLTDEQRAIWRFPPQDP